MKNLNNIVKSDATFEILDDSEYMHPLNEYEVVDYKPAENNSEFLGRENFGDVYEFEVSGLEYIARVYYNRNHSPGTKEIDFRLKETDSYSNRVNKGPGHLFSVVHTVLKIVDDVAKKDKVKRFLITGEGDNKDYGKEKTSRADVYERIIKRIYPEEAISVYKNKILIDMTKVYPDIIKDDEMDRIIKMLTHNLLKISDENPDPYSISAGIDVSHSDSVLEGKFPVQILNSKFGKIELEFYVDLEEAFCELEWRFENGESGNKEFNNADEMALFLERKFSPDSLDEIRNIIKEALSVDKINESKTYTVDTSQEALEDEMYDAQGETQTFIRPAIDDYPEETYEDLFGDYENPEIVPISDIVSDRDIEGYKMMISKQGKYGIETIESLKDAMINGRPVPPVTLNKSWSGEFNLVSGRHRILAALELGLTHVPVLKMYRRNESLNESVISEYKEVWYHGTPDVRELEKEGGFSERYLNIEYVDDVEGFDRVQDEIGVARESGDEDKYLKLLSTVNSFRKSFKIRKPIFLTDTYSIARTYADPQRAFDYQNSVEKVLSIRMKDGKGVTINATGDRFRFIDINKVKKGFISAGVDVNELDLVIRKLNYAVGVDKGIRTDNVAAIGDWFNFDYIDVVGVLDSYNGGNTKSTVRMVFDPSDIEIVKNEINNPLNELEQYLNEAFGSINESDEPSPTFEWDIAKEKIDKSKKGINTAEKAYEYLNWFLDKVKSLPKSIKLKLTKYTVMSLMVLLGAGAINGIVSDKAPEISQSIAIAISAPEEVPEIEVAPEKEVYSKPTEVSGSLISFLKDEEGSAEQKGEPVLTAYDNLGDGMVTIGYGHAERIESTELIPDVTTITRERADELLAKDIEDAKAGLDRLLGRWDEAGIEYSIDQGMYNAMTSMIFNMGIGNFLTSDFIQLVKSGDYEEAADKILTTNVSYLGHISRRKEEKEMFTSGNNTQAQQLAMKEVRSIVRQVLSESVIEETQTGQKDLEKFVNDIMLFLGKRIVKEYEHNALLDPLSPHLRFLPELRTGTMTGEGFEEMGEFVKNTSIKVIPTTTIGGNPETKGMLSYGRPIQNGGKEVFEIRLKYEDEKLDEINQMFAEKPLGEVSYKDVYFKIFYMFNSVLLHEVQHAYDAWRSKGKALDNADNKGFVDRSRKAKALARSKKYDDLTPEEIKAIGDSYAEYQNLVHEINARYAQTMNKVRMTSLDDDWNHVEKPWKSVYSDFKTHFDGWSRLSDKMKKKLTRRLAKAFQESSDRISTDTAKANEKEPKSVMSESLKGDDCNSFFDINSLDRYVEFEKPLYSMIAKRKTAKLVYISPKQYIYKIAHGFGGLSYDDVVDSGAVVKSNIDKYADAMLAGDKFPIGHYTKDGENQEGRHRALAAMKIGCEKIPVIQFMKISDKEFLNTVNRLKGMSFDELDGLFKKIGFKNGITQLGYNDLKRYVDYNLQENNAKLDRVRGMVRRVLKESVIEEIIEGEFNAYHGSPTKIDKFTDDFVGGEKANDAQGAGIYFATNPEDASYYGDHIYKVIIKGNFLDRNAPIENVDVEELVKLIKMKDEWEMNAQDYSPDPEAGAYEAAYRTIEYNGDEAEAFQQIEADFYRYDSVDYVRNMTKLGYDGIIVDAPSGFVGDKHIIVFNPDAVTLTGKL